MVVWQNSLNRHHKFEILSQEFHSKGRGRGYWTWIRNLDPRGQAVRVFKILLAQRLRQIAECLEREARQEAYTSMSVEKSAMVMNALRSPLIKSVERFESTSSELISVM